MQINDTEMVFLRVKTPGNVKGSDKIVAVPIFEGNRDARHWRFIAREIHRAQISKVVLRTRWTDNDLDRATAVADCRDSNTFDYRWWYLPRNFLQEVTKINAGILFLA
jgi:hypothetical protein